MSTAELSPEHIQEKFTALAELESDFDAADVEILRETTRLHAPLLERREKIISTIPGFWPHVLDEASAPLGLEEHIQPEDSMALSSLTNLNVTRPNALNGGDPRDIAFEFVFEESEYFPAQTVKKLFKHQGAGAGISGLISEPVQMEWKPKKDLTKGLQKAAVEAFEERKEKAKKGLKGPEARKLGEKEKALVKILEKSNSNSFFNWFSFTGPHKDLGELEDEEEDEKKDEDEMKEDMDLESPVEAFGYGDEIAVALAEDLYPNAVKYFTSSLIDEDENDDDSEIDIEDDSEADDIALKEILAKQVSKDKKADKSSKKRKDESEPPSKKKAKKESA